MTATRITTFTVEGPALELFVSDCTCGVVFAMPRDLERRRRQDRRPFWCPNGHELVFNDKTDEQKLREEKARTTALEDQLAAAVRDADATRAALIRDRGRFAVGICPCCNRSFTNVRRHMATQHPDYDVTKVDQPAHEKKPRYGCSCGRDFDTLHGLRIHQGRSRRDGWETSKWRPSQHLTEV